MPPPTDQSPTAFPLLVGPVGCTLCDARLHSLSDEFLLELGQGGHSGPRNLPVGVGERYQPDQVGLLMLGSCSSSTAS